MPDAQSLQAIRAALGQRSVVLVGLMGCGKSAIGRRLAKIDRFSRAPIAGLEDADSVSAAPPSRGSLPEGGLAGASSR